MKIFFSLLILSSLLSCKEQAAETSKACPEDNVAVCGQPKMIICPKGQICPMVMPIPKTYLNICFLNKAGSKFISNGACAKF